jgi:hypothetical protein
MQLCEVAPCLDCGADPRELEDWRNGEHTYSKVGLFDDELLCDFCDADMPSTDPLFWGFPAELDWDAALGSYPYAPLPSRPPLRTEPACPKCGNTLRKQEFIRRNAERNGVSLPRKYWPRL